MKNLIFNKFGKSKLKVFKTRDVKLPERHGKNAGFDFFVPNDFKKTIINSLQNINIPSGIIVKMPPGHALIAFNKSGMAVNNNLQVGACIIDENYTGEIHLNIVNLKKKKFEVKPGMKLVQFVLIKINYAIIVEHDYISEMYTKKDYKERGQNAFGSTGI